jgi:hypothetical protein
MGLLETHVTCIEGTFGDSWATDAESKQDVF